MAWNAPSGLSNCWRSLAYWTVDLEREAGAADGVRGEQHDAVEHRLVPGGPTGARVADAVRGRDATRRESVTSYWVSEAMVSCWVERDAGGLRVDQEQVDAVAAVRASTTNWSATLAKGTCHLVPSRM